MGSEFDIRLQRLRGALEGVQELLGVFDEQHWSRWFARCQVRLDANDPIALDKILRAFGGMGRFNDLVLSRRDTRLRPADPRAMSGWWRVAVWEGAGVDGIQFVREIRGLMDEALAIAERSFDVRDEETVLIRLAARLRAHPEHRDAAEVELSTLAAQVAATPDPDGGVELLSYVMHTVELPGLARRVEELLLAARTAGSTGRPWEWARRMERILEARDQNWPDRDMFRSLKGLIAIEGVVRW